MIACINTGQNLLFIYLGRPLSDGGAQWWSYFAAPPITSNQMISAVFLEMNVSIQLSIFSARTEGPFYIRRPGTWVLFAFFTGVLLASLIAGFWTLNASLQLGDGALMDGLHDVRVVCLIYLYCVFWFLAMELVKVIVYVVWEAVQFREVDNAVAHALLLLTAFSGSTRTSSSSSLSRVTRRT